jgi:hypothetical protein
LVRKKEGFMAVFEVLGRSVPGVAVPTMRRAPASRLGCWLGGCAVVAVATLGCGKPTGVSFAPVTGRVVVNGQPLAAGTIHFFPDESKGTSGPMSTGALQSDGSYTLRGPGLNVGAMVGNHRVYLTLPFQDVTPTPVVVDGAVVLQAPPSEPAAGTLAQIPKTFLQPETSAWTATVAEGKANVLDFEITK